MGSLSYRDESAEITLEMHRAPPVAGMGNAPHPCPGGAGDAGVIDK